MSSYQGKKRPRRYFENDGDGDGLDESGFSRTTHHGRGEEEWNETKMKKSRTTNEAAEFDDTRLPFELKEYVKSVADGISNVETNEDLNVDEVASKCIVECRGHEIAACCDAETSRDVERICRASLASCLQFCNQLLMNKRKSIVRLCTRSVGSRCLESILYELRNYLLQRSDETGAEDAITTVLGQLGEVIAEEFDALVSHMCSTHILRAFGRVCCGLEKPQRNRGGATGDGGWNNDRKNGRRLEELRTRLLANPELKSSLTGIVARVLDWKSMYEYYHQESISCLVQEYVQLEATMIPNSDRSSIRQLITTALGEEYKGEIVQHLMSKQASRIWESIIQHCPVDEAIDQLYRKQLIGRLPELVGHPFANFPLQRLLERCRGKVLAKAIIDELMAIFDDLWTSNRVGVLVALATCCKNNGVRQKDFKKALRIASECEKNQMFVSLLQLAGHGRPDGDQEADQEKKEGLGLTKENITSHGSALVQQLFHFRKPQPFADGLLALKIDQLLMLACHPAGSHLFDAFFSSETIPEEQKSALAVRLTERSILVLMACDKFGSRLVDNLWNRGADKDRNSVAASLTTDKAMTALSRSPYGKILWTKYQLERFKISPKDWRTFMGGVKGKKRMLEDLLK